MKAELSRRSEALRNMQRKVEHLNNTVRCEELEMGSLRFCKVSFSWHGSGPAWT